MTPEEIEQLADLVAARIATQQRPRLVDAEAVAKQLGVKATWVRQEARADRIPHVRVGKYVRFSPTAVDAWCEEQTRGPQPDTALRETA